MAEELITLVDEKDNVLSSMDKYDAHRHPAQLHRAISVWLWRKNKNTGDVEVLLQKRSEQKIVGAGWWGNTVCGNVWWRESYEDCAKRRLAVELGVQSPPELKKLYSFRYKAYCNETFGEHEWDTVFTGEVSYPEFNVTPNPAEVAETLWVSLTELKKTVAEACVVLPQKRYALPSETLAEDLSLDTLKSMTQRLEVTIGAKEISLAPWTAMMLCDEKLLFS